MASPARISSAIKNNSVINNTINHINATKSINNNVVTTTATTTKIDHKKPQTIFPYNASHLALDHGHISVYVSGCVSVSAAYRHQATGGTDSNCSVRRLFWEL